MINVDIWKSRYFRKTGKIERLNGHIRLHSTFQLHQVATATGCQLNEAFEILHYAVVAGALSETTIFYEKHSNDAIHIGEIAYLKVYDEENDRHLEECDLTWEPYFFLTPEARAGGWQFIRSM